MPSRSAQSPAGRAARLLGTALLAGMTASLLVAVGPPAAGAPPTPAEVAEQRAEAEALADELEAQERTGDAARSRLDELTAAANAALEAHQQAEKARWEAEATHWAESERLDLTQQTLRAERGELGRWAAETYRDGVAGGIWELNAVLGARSTDDLTQRLALLEVVARTQGQAIAGLQKATVAQATVSADTEETARLVFDATLAAAAAQEDSERLVAEQAEEVTRLEAELAQTQHAADAAQDQADRLAAARALADAQLAEEAQREAARRAEEARRGSGGTNRVTGAIGSCRGQDVSWFPNGRIPADALCPMWGAPGHLLRADAAAAFDSLAEAFASDVGRPLCVTDSYRPLDDQVRLYATKPHLAAVPGTSNHGWGVALDLCGGIQRFGTATHRWMQRYAPLHGWFHPGWAQQGGSRPEAWHWEYGG